MTRYRSRLVLWAILTLLLGIGVIGQTFAASDGGFSARRPTAD
jgi:hypothetical protein